MSVTTKQLKRGDKILISCQGTVLNSIKDREGNVIGYRVTDGKRPAFWLVVPLHAISTDLNTLTPPNR